MFVIDDKQPSDFTQHSTVWGQPRWTVMRKCDERNRSLSSSTTCQINGVQVWTNVFAIEEDIDMIAGEFISFAY